MPGAGRGSLLLANLLASLLRSAVAFSAWQSDMLSEQGPIIAVMAQPYGNVPDYLPASYVKWLELGGARVVPVMYEATDREVDTIFANTNGLLLIGGAAPICSAARRFLSNAVEAAKAGDAYPIWGTCDGFEWLMQMASEEVGVLHDGFDSENLPLSLDLTAAAASSRLLAEAGDTMAQRSPKLSVLEALGSLPVTFNSHKQGVTPAAFAASAPLSAFFTVLATNRDRKGRSFVSMVEAVDPRLRVYATQFHPEKNLFEWGQAASGELLQAIPHSRAAVAVSQYFANFFVDECRASAHRFASPTDQWKQLIYHSPHWLAQPTLFSPNFVESYVFGASRPNGTRNR